MREAAQSLGVNTATIVRYDSPGAVTVLGGWSETGPLLFPVGSRSSSADEGSALVEVYRTGEARRVDVSGGRREPRRGPPLARLPLERGRAGEAR